MQRWQYYVEYQSPPGGITKRSKADRHTSFLNRLDALGRDGWELVNYQPIPEGKDVWQYLLIFKRPVA